MVYTATQLISRSLYLSGIVAKDEQTPSGTQINDGLSLLNAVLAIKTANKRLIPYYTSFDFNPVVGQETYFIENLIHVETITFNIGVVRYSMMEIKRKRYFGDGRVDNILSLPFSWHFERQFGGGNLYLYFLPNQVYPIKMWCKFTLQAVTLDQDLSLSMEPFYIEYLRYALAEYICQEYSIDVPPQTAQKLSEYESIIQDISPLDLTMTKSSCLQSSSTLNWGDINIGKGFRP